MQYIGKIPEDLRYTKEHEWIKHENDVMVMGITDYAQHALTDIVFVELPNLGKIVGQLKPFCVVESVKSVSDIFAPVSGEVVEVNNTLIDAPEFINQEPYERGWIAKIKSSNKVELNNLMDANQYKKYLEGLG